MQLHGSMRKELDVRSPLLNECVIMNSMSEVCSLECYPEYTFFGEHKLNAILEAG